MDIPEGCPLVYVSFTADIDSDATENLIAVMSRLARLKVKKVYLLLSTLGGSVTNGLALFNLLRGMPFKLVTHNIGNVDSIGNVLFLAGEERYTCESATFMFHGVHSGPIGEERPDVKTIQEKLDGLINDQKRICKVICSRTKIVNREVEQLFKQGQTKDAAFALDKGIVNEIKDVQIDYETPFITIVFKPALPN